MIMRMLIIKYCYKYQFMSMKSYLANRIKDVATADADGLMDCISSALDDAGISWKQKLVRFGADGASVNFGRKNGVYNKLSEQSSWSLASTVWHTVRSWRQKMPSKVLTSLRSVLSLCVIAT